MGPLLHTLRGWPAHPRAPPAWRALMQVSAAGWHAVFCDLTRMTSCTHERSQHLNVWLNESMPDTLVRAPSIRHGYVTRRAL